MTSLPHTPIELIALDMDGTLLTSQHTIHPEARRTIQAARSRGVRLVVATGKSLYAIRSIIRELALDTPSVCMQGLMVYGPDESIWFERTIDPSVTRDVVRYAADQDLALFAYERERLVTNRPSIYIQRFADHHEPVAEVLPDFTSLLPTLTLNKLNIMHPDEHIPRIRADLTDLLGKRASLVQAMSHSLEILPPGSSKGNGLRWLLDRLGVDPAQVLAVGDGENDAEMLAMAGVGAAVANAMPAARAAADVVVASNDDGGVAEAIERFVLAPSYS